jgi:phosphinothricin acetyltransferase
MTIRPATAADGVAIAAIANPMVRDTTITFTTEEKMPEAIALLIDGGRRHWVAEIGGEVLGFATHFPFRSGPGYAFTREHTIALAPQARGRGMGRALMAAVEADAAANAARSLFAGVSGENAAGAAFHAALGFSEVARLTGVGWKFGRWHDLVLMQKMLPTPDNSRKR